jgi:putative two-component system response regulator
LDLTLFGNGYLSGLKGERIPLDARILAVADSFDAITSEKP